MENEVLGYQDVEISRDKNYEPAVLKKYRENKARAEQNIKLLDLFDKDVIILLDILPPPNLTVMVGESLRPITT